MVIMHLLIFPPMKIFSRGIVYPLDASFMKTVLKVPSWIVEIDRYFIKTISSFNIFTSYIFTFHRIKIVTHKNWVLCAITSVQSSQQQTMLSRCRMILVNLERYRSTAYNRYYTLIVPKIYGINFTITKLQTRYSGL